MPNAVREPRRLPANRPSSSRSCSAVPMPSSNLTTKAMTKLILGNWECLLYIAHFMACNPGNLSYRSLLSLLNGPDYPHSCSTKLATFTSSHCCSFYTRQTTANCLQLIQAWNNAHYRPLTDSSIHLRYTPAAKGHVHGQAKCNY